MQMKKIIELSREFLKNSKHQISKSSNRQTFISQISDFYTKIQIKALIKTYDFTKSQSPATREIDIRRIVKFFITQILGFNTFF